MQPAQAADISKLSKLFNVTEPKKRTRRKETLLSAQTRKALVNRIGFLKVGKKSTPSNVQIGKFVGKVDARLDIDAEIESKYNFEFKPLRSRPVYRSVDSFVQSVLERAELAPETSQVREVAGSVQEDMRHYSALAREARRNGNKLADATATVHSDEEQTRTMLQSAKITALKFVTEAGKFVTKKGVSAGATALLFMTVPVVSVPVALLAGATIIGAEVTICVAIDGVEYDEKNGYQYRYAGSGKKESFTHAIAKGLLSKGVAMVVGGGPLVPTDTEWNMWHVAAGVVGHGAHNLVNPLTGSTAKFTSLGGPGIVRTLMGQPDSVGGLIANITISSALNKALQTGAMHGLDWVLGKDNVEAENLRRREEQIRAEQAFRAKERQSKVMMRLAEGYSLHEAVDTTMPMEQRVTERGKHFLKESKARTWLRRSVTFLTYASLAVGGIITWEIAASLVESYAPGFVSKYGTEAVIALMKQMMANPSLAMFAKTIVAENIYAFGQIKTRVENMVAKTANQLRGWTKNAVRTHISETMVDKIGYRLFEDVVFNHFLTGVTNYGLQNVAVSTTVGAGETVHGAYKAKTMTEEEVAAALEAELKSGAGHSQSTLMANALNRGTALPEAIDMLRTSGIKSSLMELGNMLGIVSDETMNTITDERIAYWYGFDVDGNKFSGGTADIPAATLGKMYRLSKHYNSAQETAAVADMLADDLKQDMEENENLVRMLDSDPALKSQAEVAIREFDIARNALNKSLRNMKGVIMRADGAEIDAKQDKLITSLNNALKQLDNIGKLAKLLRDSMQVTSEKAAELDDSVMADATTTATETATTMAQAKAEDISSKVRQSIEFAVKSEMMEMLRTGIDPSSALAQEQLRKTAAQAFAVANNNEIGLASHELTEVLRSDLERLITGKAGTEAGAVAAFANGLSAGAEQFKNSLVDSLQQLLYNSLDKTINGVVEASTRRGMELRGMATDMEKMARSASSRLNSNIKPQASKVAADTTSVAFTEALRAGKTSSEAASLALEQAKEATETVWNNAIADAGATNMEAFRALGLEDPAEFNYVLGALQAAEAASFGSLDGTIPMKTFTKSINSAIGRRDTDVAANIARTVAGQQPDFVRIRQEIEQEALRIAGDTIQGSTVLKTARTNFLSVYKASVENGVSNALEHFKSRIESGLRSSDLDPGMQYAVLVKSLDRIKSDLEKGLNTISKDKLADLIQARMVSSMEDAPMQSAVQSEVDRVIGMLKPPTSKVPTFSSFLAELETGAGPIEQIETDLADAVASVKLQPVASVEVPKIEIDAKNTVAQAEPEKEAERPPQSLNAEMTQLRGVAITLGTMIGEYTAEEVTNMVSQLQLEKEDEANMLLLQTETKLTEEQAAKVSETLVKAAEVVKKKIGLKGFECLAGNADSSCYTNSLLRAGVTTYATSVGLGAAVNYFGGGAAAAVAAEVVDVADDIPVSGIASTLGWGDAVRVGGRLTRDVTSLAGGAVRSSVNAAAGGGANIVSSLAEAESQTGYLGWALGKTISGGKWAVGKTVSGVGWGASKLGSGVEYAAKKGATYMGEQTAEAIGGAVAGQSDAGTLMHGIKTAGTFNPYKAWLRLGFSFAKEASSAFDDVGESYRLATDDETGMFSKMYYGAKGLGQLGYHSGMALANSGSVDMLLGEEAGNAYRATRNWYRGNKVQLDDPEALADITFAIGDMLLDRSKDKGEEKP